MLLKNYRPQEVEVGSRSLHKETKKRKTLLVYKNILTNSFRFPSKLKSNMPPQLTMAHLALVFMHSISPIW
jgi:hypothetical protein